MRQRLLYFMFDYYCCKGQSLCNNMRIFLTNTTKKKNAALLSSLKAGPFEISYLDSDPNVPKNAYSIPATT